MNIRFNKVMFSIIFIFVLVIGSGCSLSKQFTKEFDANNYVEAGEIYVSKIKGNEAEEKKFKAEVEKKIDSIFSDYLLLKKDAEQSVLIFNELKMYNLFEEKIDEKIEDIYKVKTSRINFDEGKKFLNEGEYLQGALKINQVIEIDPNYKEANKLVENNKENINQAVLEEASVLIGKNEFKEAIEILKDSEKFQVGNSITEKIKEYTKLRNTYYSSRVDYLKNRVAFNYDNVDKTYTIVGKGLKPNYFNISRTLNIEPRIMVMGGKEVEEQDPAFVLTLGFTQDNWVFFNQVTFAMDEKRESIEAEYLSKQTEVHYGGVISELVNIIHDEELAGIKETVIDMSNLIGNLLESEETTIRFSGDGKRDHKMTLNEKERIRDIWELYNILKDDPEMILELIN